MIYVIATLTLTPGARAKIQAAAEACIAATRAEDGCLSYDLHESLTDPQSMVFVERWQSRAALTAHSKQPHLKAWRDASGPYLTSRVIEIIHPEKTETF